MRTPTTGAGAQLGNASASAAEVEKKNINMELWQACAGPLVNLPAAGTHVVYFPQGHSEQVAASMKKDVDGQIPNYPNLPSKLLCLLHNVTLHADPETDEVYAQMTLQPMPSFDKDALLRSDLSTKINKPQTEFFCKTLTASDTSTHGGFSVPRRAAEKIFPQLDFTMQPPAQELMARDLHDNVWKFRHIYRGHPKRHLLTTGWSLFVSGKRLFAGDSVLFIRDDKQQLLLGIRRANRQPTNLSSSVLSSDSMHIGILAAAAHAAANNSPFTVFYNPRASPSEFVIPLAKYYKAVCSNQISLGMRFRMVFETEESGTRRYMGTITSISDLDPVRWKNSQWRNVQVGWDESTAGEKRTRVSIWEIEPITAPFFICPTPPLFGLKRPRQPGMPDDYSSELDSLFRRTMPWLGDDFGLKDAQPQHGLSLVQWMNLHQNQPLANSMQPNYMSLLPGSVLPNLPGTDLSHQLTQIPQQNTLQFNAPRQMQPVQHLDQLHKLPTSTVDNFGSILQPQQQLADISQLPTQNMVSQTLSTSQNQPPNLLQQPQQTLLNHQLQRNISQNPPLQQQNLMQSLIPDQVNPQLHTSENQIQLQLLQKLQQQSLLAQQSAVQQPSQLIQSQDNHQKQIFDVPSSFSRFMSTNQMLDSSQVAASSMMTRNSSQANFQFAQPMQQPKLPQSGMVSELPGHMAPINNQLSAGGGQSAVTDDVPSCSTSPSANNQSLVNSRNQCTLIIGDEIANPGGFETVSSTGNLVKGLQRKTEVKPSVNISKGQNQSVFVPQSCPNATGTTQIDYLDSSSATSVISQNDVQIPQGNKPMSLNSQSMLFRDASQDGEILQGDSGSNVLFGASVDNQLGLPMMPESLILKNMAGSGKDFPTDPSSAGGMLSGYDNIQEPQPELSTSMVSQSFGVPDMTFNSIDSTINDGSFMNRGAAWVPPQMPRLRTYTKVYKRGAVGRSIDMTRYSGYDELKQDLARRFGIEGQLEDRQRIGWKLVYVDHENDVLLVGDDPWEEFVNCVRCIKILSPQEVQQMSFDGDIGNNIIPNQACSSSDNGVG